MFATHLEHALEVFHGNLLAMARSHCHSFVSISDHASHLLTKSVHHNYNRVSKVVACEAL